MGGVHNTRGNSRGVEGYFCGKKNGNSGEEGGVLREIPSMVGVWIFSGTTQYKLQITSSAEVKLYILNWN